MVRLSDLVAGAVWMALAAGVCSVRAAEKETLPTPPPMARPQTVSVYSGEPAQIKLSVGGRIVEPLRILIRTPPERGQLGELRRTGRNTAVVEYYAPDSPGDDSFTFAAQSPDSPVSAPARIRIVINDAPVRLEFERELDFGDVFLGESVVRDFLVRNAGGGTASGRVQTAPPWSVVGPADYRIPKGWDVGIGLEFRPTDEREFAGQVALGPGREMTVTVRGKGALPLAWEPAAIVVEPEAREKGAVEFRVRNLTGDMRLVGFVWPDGVSGPDEVEIAAGEERRIVLNINPSDPQSLDGRALIRSGGFERSVPVRLFPGPGRLVAEPDVFEMGEIPFGRNVSLSLTLRNAGIGDAAIKLDMPAHVAVVPDPAGVILRPGEERKYEVTFQGLASGVIRDELVFGYPPERRLVIPFRGNVIPAASHALPEAPPRESPTWLIPPADDPGRPGLQPPDAVFADQRTPNSVVLSWETAPEAKTYRVEFRRVGPLERGRIRAEWVEFPNVVVDVKPDTVHARFTGLASGYSWTIRVVAMDDYGEEGVPSMPFQMSTLPPVRVEWPGWISVVAVVGLAGILFAFWRRRRAAREAVHDERISQLGQP